MMRTVFCVAIVKSINLADVANGDGSAGFVINGAKKGGQSGHSVAGVGDMNGDGYDDLIIGAKAVGEQEGLWRHNISRRKLCHLWTRKL